MQVPLFEEHCLERQFRNIFRQINRQSQRASWLRVCRLERGLVCRAYMCGKHICNITCCQAGLKLVEWKAHKPMMGRDRVGSARGLKVGTHIQTHAGSRHNAVEHQKNGTPSISCVATCWCFILPAFKVGQAAHLLTFTLPFSFFINLLTFFLSFPQSCSAVE